jgi:predicted AlkP superfamily pyrophosphatase or phosphodiesterase
MVTWYGRITIMDYRSAENHITIYGHIHLTLPMDIEFFEIQLRKLADAQSFASDFVLPDYNGLNLKNILPQIGAVFGVSTLACSTSPSDCLTELKGVRKVVLVVFDGLGYNRLLSHTKSHSGGTFARLAEQGVLKPMTTVFPSTTSTALTSLFTGVSPAQHQIIGYHMFSKKYGLIYNTLDMKPVYGYSGRVELAQEYSCQVKPLLATLEQNGIKTSVITKSAIVGSGLSQITHKDLTPIGYLLSSDMWTHTARALHKSGPSLSVVYYSGVDNLAHKYGPYSEEVTFELTSIEHNLDTFIQGLSKEVKEETLLVFVADHGIAEAKQSLYLKDTAQLMQHLILPPVGDGRATYLFCKPNRTQ